MGVVVRGWRDGSYSTPDEREARNRAKAKTRITAETKWLSAQDGEAKVVRNITSTENKQPSTQWRTAWAMLPDEWRNAIARFCVLTDADVGEACGFECYREVRAIY